MDGRPFKSIEDVGFSTFSKPAMKGLDIHYNRKNTGELVGDAAMSLKNELRKDIEKSLACVKVDCATRHYRSFLGMNVQVNVNVIDHNYLQFVYTSLCNYIQSCVILFCI